MASRSTFGVRTRGAPVPWLCGCPLSAGRAIGGQDPRARLRTAFAEAVFSRRSPSRAAILSPILTPLRLGVGKRGAWNLLLERLCSLIWFLPYKVDLRIYPQKLLVMWEMQACKQIIVMLHGKCFDRRFVQCFEGSKSKEAASCGLLGVLSIFGKGPSSQGYGFSSGHVWMWELDCEESWVPKNWCFWAVVLEKTLERPLDYKEIQPVHPKWDRSWVFIGRTDAEAETPIFWPPHVKSWLIGKDPDAGRDWGAGEGDDQGWDGWMASLTRRTWGWVNSGSWWWTGRPGVLRFMGSQRVGHDWATELNWYLVNVSCFKVTI